MRTNSTWRRISARLLCAALALALLPTAAMSEESTANEVLGHELEAKSTELARGVTLVQRKCYSDSHSDYLRENYIVCEPSACVIPVVYDGDYSCSWQTTSAAARKLEAQGLRVVAGINASHFDIKGNGAPRATTIVNGVLRNFGVFKKAFVGFTADGSSVLGEPGIRMELHTNAGNYTITRFNPGFTDVNYLNLYDYMYKSSHTTGTSMPCVDAICSVEGGELGVGCTLTLRVKEVLSESHNTPIPKNHYVLSARTDVNESKIVSALAAGDIVTVTTSNPSPQWAECVNLVGGGLYLVRNGAIVDNGDAVNPLTAVGQRADGSLILYTVDGRQPGYSAGITYTELANRMLELGCVTAITMDGGGSTTMVATMPDETAARVVNTPCDRGGERKIPNHIFLVMPNSYTVEFVNEDGTVLQSGAVAYGATPSYTGATPTKAATAQYTYTFDKWSPAIAAVTGNATYTATYKQTTRSYTVTWKNADGCILKTETVAYGATPSYSGATPTKAAADGRLYTFAGWSPAIAAVTGDQTYTATFDSLAGTVYYVETTAVYMADGSYFDLDACYDANGEVYRLPSGCAIDALGTTVLADDASNAVTVDLTGGAAVNVAPDGAGTVVAMGKKELFAGAGTTVLIAPVGAVSLNHGTENQIDYSPNGAYITYSGVPGGFWYVAIKPYDNLSAEQKSALKSLGLRQTTP